MSEVGTSGWTFPDNIRTDSWVEQEDNDDIYYGWMGTTQSIVHTTWTYLKITHDLYDPQDIHNTAYLKTLMYIPRTGSYMVAAQCFNQVNTTDYRVTALELWKNNAFCIKGINVIASGWPAGHNNCLELTGVFDAVEDDYIELKYYQRNNSNVNKTAQAWITFMRITGDDDHGDPT